MKFNGSRPPQFRQCGRWERRRQLIDALITTHPTDDVGLMADLLRPLGIGALVAAAPDMVTNRGDLYAVAQRLGIGRDEVDRVAHRICLSATLDTVDDPYSNTAWFAAEVSSDRCNADAVWICFVPEPVTDKRTDDA